MGEGESKLAAGAIGRRSLELCWVRNSNCGELGTVGSLELWGVSGVVESRHCHKNPHSPPQNSHNIFRPFLPGSRLEEFKIWGVRDLGSSQFGECPSSVRHPHPPPRSPPPGPFCFLIFGGESDVHVLPCLSCFSPVSRLRGNRCDALGTLRVGVWPVMGWWVTLELNLALFSNVA